MKRQKGKYIIIRTYEGMNEGQEDLLGLLNEGWKIDSVAGSGNFVEYILWSSPK